MFDAVGRAQVLEQADLHRDLALIVLDLALPDGNGLDLLMEFRSRHPSTDVVVLSASNELGIVAKALRLGAQGFIPKSAPYAVMMLRSNSCWPVAFSFRPKSWLQCRTPYRAIC